MIWNKLSWPISCIIALGAMQQVAGCSKHSPHAPLRCKDVPIQNELLKQNTALVNNSQVNLNVIKITTLKKLSDDTINCQTLVNYTHKVIPSKKYLLTYNFTLNSDGKITALSPQSNLKYINYKTWLAQLPQLINHQSSRGGSLDTLQTLDKNKYLQQLYLNNNLISFQGQENFNKITIVQSITLANQDIFIFNINNSNYLLSIHSESQIYISPKFTYQNINIDQSKSQIRFFGLRKYQFSESTDYPIYQFQNNQLKLIQTNRSLTYYQHKFSTTTAAQILTQIKSDGCLNGDQFYLSDICTDNISTYCFKFNSISKPQKTKPYWLLQNMCQNHYEYSD